MGRFAYRDIKPKVTKTAALDDGIETINLEGLGYITQLDLQFACAATDGTDIGTLPWKVVTKIEVLGNGSSVLKSYNPNHLKAIAAYSGIDLCAHGQYGRHGTEDQYFWRFPVLFGRYPGDPKYMLDTDAWETLQAKIHWNAAEVTHDGQTYEATGSPAVRYAADATVYEGGAPPGNQGYIKTMEINKYTMAASTRYTTEIPRGHPLRGLTTRFCYADDKWYYFYNKYNLNFDNGKWIPINCEYRHLLGLITKWFPREYNYTQYIDTDSGTEIDTCFGLVHSCTGSSGGLTDMEFTLGHGPDFGLTTTGVANATNTATTVPGAFINHFSGLMPMHVVYFPMWWFADIEEDAVSTDNYKRIDFEHETDSNAGAGTATICAEYLVPQGQV